MRVFAVSASRSRRPLMRLKQTDKRAAHTTVAIDIDQLALAHDCSSTNCEEYDSLN